MSIVDTVPPKQPGRPTDVEAAAVEEYHAAMILFNATMKARHDRPSHSKDYAKEEKESDAYFRALRGYNSFMEQYNKARLDTLGGWAPIDTTAPPATALPPVLIPVHASSNVGGGDPRHATRTIESYVLPGILTPDECTMFIDVSKTIGYRDLVSDVTKSDRSNTRLILSDVGLAEALWPRILPHVPPLLTDSMGKWVPFGLNERFRFCRYEAGQHFAAHRDDRFINAAATLKSKLTVVFYLNTGDGKDFEDGALNFLRGQWKDVSDKASAPSNVVHTVVPVAGTAAMFDQALLHEGAMISSGVKFLMRTDVLYRAESTPRRLCRRGNGLTAGV